MRRLRGGPRPGIDGYVGPLAPGTSDRRAGPRGRRLAGSSATARYYAVGRRCDRAGSLLPAAGRWSQFWSTGSTDGAMDEVSELFPIGCFAAGLALMRAMGWRQLPGPDDPELPPGPIPGRRTHTGSTVRAAVDADAPERRAGARTATPTRRRGGPVDAPSEHSIRRSTESPEFPSMKCAHSATTGNFVRRHS